MTFPVPGVIYRLGKKKKKTRHTLSICFSTLQVLSLSGKLPGKAREEEPLLRYMVKEMRSARRRVREQTKESKDRHRWCSWVEATMSEYDRRTRVRHLRVRAFKAARSYANLKAVAVNIYRATAIRKAVNNGRTAYGGLLAPIHTIYVVKDRFLIAWGRKNFHAFWPPLWAVAHSGGTSDA
jgi:Transposase DDE domain